MNGTPANGTPAPLVDVARWWRSVGPETLRADLLAAFLGALLVLPQGVAFARLAGLPPEFGIYTALVPCVVAALFGSSLHVTSGPTNALSLAIFAMLAPLAPTGSPEYIQLVLATTLLVGLMQLLIATLRLGVLANFIAPSVLTGFVAGAACLIGWHALLGLESLYRESASGGAIELAIAVATLLATIAVARWRPRWPAMLIGLLFAWVLATFAARAGFAAQPLGALRQVLPPLSNPLPSPGQLPSILGIALALTLISLAQSISIAKAIAQRSGQVLHTNREIRGQGLSNIAGSFFSSYVSCGSFNRSLPNYEAGARTPLAAAFSALFLLLLVGLAGPLIAGIPLAAIEALLLYVAWQLVDIPRIRTIARYSHGDAITLGATWLATMTIRIELAILLGMALALGFYLDLSARPAMRRLVPWGPTRRFTPITQIDEPVRECPQLLLMRMEGAVYFAASAHVRDELRGYRERTPGQKHLLVMAKSMNFIDQAGDQLWREELGIRRAAGGDLYFHRPRPPVLIAWQRSGMAEELGSANVFQTKNEAIACIVKERLDPGICATCTARIFDECALQPGPGH